MSQKCKHTAEAGGQKKDRFGFGWLYLLRLQLLITVLLIPQYTFHLLAPSRWGTRLGLHDQGLVSDVWMRCMAELITSGSPSRFQGSWLWTSISSQVTSCPYWLINVRLTVVTPASGDEGQKKDKTNKRMNQLFMFECEIKEMIGLLLWIYLAGGRLHLGLMTEIQDWRVLFPPSSTEMDYS